MILLLNIRVKNVNSWLDKLNFKYQRSKFMKLNCDKLKLLFCIRIYNNDDDDEILVLNFI